MGTTERAQQMRIVAEILLVHAPDLLREDQDLVRDLLSVAGTALHTIHEDVEKSAKAWDKRAYHVRADELRREWAWVPGASNYAVGLALREPPVTVTDVQKLRTLIGPELERPARRQIKDPTLFRGAADAVRQKRANRRKPIRG